MKTLMANLAVGARSIGCWIDTPPVLAVTDAVILRPHRSPVSYA